MKYLNKIFFILGNRSKKLYFFVLGSIFSSFLDIIGIGLLLPLLQRLNKNNSESTTNFFEVFLFKHGIKEHEIILAYCFIILFVSIFKFIFAIFIQYNILKFSYNEHHHLLIKLFKKFIYSDYSTFFESNTANLVQTINVESSIFTNKALIPLLKIVSESLVIITLTSVLIIKEPFIVLMMIIMLSTIVIIYDKILKNRTIGYGIDFSNSSELILKDISQIIKGIREIKMFNKELFFINRVITNSNKYSNAGTKYNTYIGIPRFLFELSLILFIITLIIFLNNYTHDVNPINKISLVALIALRLIPSFSQISSSINQLRFSNNTVNYLFDILIKSDEKRIISNNLSKEFKFESISLQNISYTYPSRTSYAINNINFKINFGESIGIIGESGSGKSTFANVLMGFITPNSGNIILNNLILTDTSILNQHVSYIPQDIFILDSTLLENLTFGNQNDDIDLVKLDEILNQLKLKDLVDSLPNGLYTQLGQDGLKISGGQKQRIGIARSLYNKRQLIIMDESTSSLDESTQSQIQNLITSLKGITTLIIISHRKSILKDCDRIVEFNNATIIN